MTMIILHLRVSCRMLTPATIRQIMRTDKTVAFFAKTAPARTGVCGIEAVEFIIKS